jgi:hypothetical protein
MVRSRRVMPPPEPLSNLGQSGVWRFAKSLNLIRTRRFYSGKGWTPQISCRKPLALGSNTNLPADAQRYSMKRYMSVPIANALFAIYKQEVRSEFLHPVLANAMTGPGRRPEVDFAVINNYPNLSCVVESKWLGANGLSVEEVLWDLLRLELVAHYAKVPAFFLLGGRRRHPSPASCGGMRT